MALGYYLNENKGSAYGVREIRLLGTWGSPIKGTYLGERDYIDRGIIILIL